MVHVYSKLEATAVTQVENPIIFGKHARACVCVRVHVCLSVCRCVWVCVHVYQVNANLDYSTFSGISLDTFTKLIHLSGVLLKGRN